MKGDADNIEYIRGREGLEFPPGQLFRVSGTGESSAIAFSWATKARRALDIELRAHVLSFLDFDPELAPVVRYRLELGHGDSVHKFPATPPSLVVSNPMLPHRGLLTRLSAKEFRIAVWLDEIGEPPAGATFYVSAQPALGSTGRPSVVMQDVNYAVDALHQFPVEAREFRIRSEASALPLPIGWGTTAMHSLTGSLLTAPIDSALYADWTPIPLLALCWSSDNLCQADYR